MKLTGTNVPVAQLTAPSALRLLKNLLTLPYIGFVPIHTDSFITKRSAEVSTQLIVSQSIGGKEYITDNIAPGPRVWTLKGYISGIPYVELSNWFMPSLTAQKLVIDTWYTSRKPVPFRTTDGEIISVLIKECSFVEEPDNMNTVRIEATLQEINYLTITSSILSGTVKGSLLSNPAVGKAIGLGLQLGTATISFIALNSSTQESTVTEEEEPILAEADGDRVSQLEVITIPDIPEDTENLAFYTVSSLGTLNLTFTFNEDLWHITAKMGEDGDLRSYTLIPNIILNPLAEDYSLYFSTDKDYIGLDDLSLAKMELVIW